MGHSWKETIILGSCALNARSEEEEHQKSPMENSQPTFRNRGPTELHKFLLHLVNAFNCMKEGSCWRNMKQGDVTWPSICLSSTLCGSIGPCVFSALHTPTSGWPRQLAKKPFTSLMRIRAHNCNDFEDPCDLFAICGFGVYHCMTCQTLQPLSWRCV